jgi:hypothetical protein
MKRVVVFSILALATLAAATSFAHGTAGHLKGTVDSVTNDHLVVKDRSGKTHEVKLDTKTRYRESAGSAAEASDLQAGDRVVVHFGEKGEGSPAVEVRFHHSPPSGEKP